MTLGRVVLIVPPFASIDRPSLSAHLLQACARRAGHDVSVLYASLSFASLIGTELYENIADGCSGDLAGERTFASVAFGLDAIPRGFSGCTRAELLRVSKLAHSWVPEFVREQVPEASVVGCTTTFEQTNASIALLRHLKCVHPATVTILGGGNCEGALANGVLSLAAPIDHVFSGESEEAFVRFLDDLRDGAAREPLVLGAPCNELDRLPTPDYQEFFEQRAKYLPRDPLANTSNTWLTYETSRGCWWGAKHHCTFCGLNDETIHFRSKSPERVLDDLDALCTTYGTRNVCMTDNIMPASYFAKLLPQLSKKEPKLHIFYEQKANMSLARVAMLKAAGINVIQPGIEALSTPLLRLMAKGVSARQNLALLRYCAAVGVSVNWNLLYGFPSDDLAWFVDTSELIALIPHLEPPSALCPLSIDRFSPYFDHPDVHGLSNVRPVGAYSEVFPGAADLSRLAYHFDADYESASLTDCTGVMSELNRAVEQWKSMWHSRTVAPPALRVTKLDDENFCLIDTRPCRRGPTVAFINRSQARTALAPMHAGAEDDWALANLVAAHVDETLVPLAIAEPSLIQEFEDEAAALGVPTRARVSLPILIA